MHVVTTMISWGTLSCASLDQLQGPCGGSPQARLLVMGMLRFMSKT